jgi:hypothetical protein
MPASKFISQSRGTAIACNQAADFVVSPFVFFRMFKTQPDPIRSHTSKNGAEKIFRAA